MATSILTIGTAQKPAGGRLRVAADLGDEDLLIQGFSIINFTVTTSGAGAPLLSATMLDYPYQLSCVCTGGTAGQSYEIVYTATLNDPDSTILLCTGVIKIL